MAWWWRMMMITLKIVVVLSRIENYNGAFGIHRQEIKVGRLKSYNKQQLQGKRTNAGLMVCCGCWSWLFAV
jgi:lysozyme family protein